VGCYIWYSEEGTVTAHPSTAGVPITVLLYNGPFFCSFKGLTEDAGRLLMWQVRNWSTLGVLHGPPHHSPAQHGDTVRPNKLLLPLDQHPSIRDVDLRCLYGFVV